MRPTSMWAGFTDELMKLALIAPATGGPKAAQMMQKPGFRGFMARLNAQQGFYGRQGRQQFRQMRQAGQVGFGGRLK